MYDLVDIREASGCSDFLEGVLNVVVVVHFLLHLLLEEPREQSLHQELLLHLDLILILVLVGSHFSDILLSLDSVHSSLEGVFLVFDRFLQTQDHLLSLPLVLGDFHHDLLEFHFGLNSFLFGPPLLLSFFDHDVLLRFHRLFQLLGSKLGRDEVRLHSLEHVLILLLSQLLKLVLEGDLLELRHLLSGSAGLHHVLIREVDLLLA